MKFNKTHPNRGFLHERILEKSMERAFADRWECMARSDSWSGDILYRIIGMNPTLRDRFVAASVIQWFGSNVGFSLLERALSDSGCSFYFFHKYTANAEPILKAMDEANAAVEARQLNFDMSEPQ